MPNARKYAVFCDNECVLQGATYKQACTLYHDMNLAFSFIERIVRRDRLDLDFPILRMAVEFEEVPYGESEEA